MSLPVIEMPAKENPPPPPPAIRPNTLENIVENLEDRISEEDELIHISPRETVEEEDVFEPPKIKPIIDSSVNSEIGQPKKQKRKYKRTAEMSEKQKEHLARIRVKAAEKRKRNAEERKLEKQEEADLKAEERLLKKKEIAKKRKEVKSKLEDVNDEPEPKPIQVQFKEEREYKEKKLEKQYQQQQYSQLDLEQAMESAVEKYDTKRKSQKKIKKAKQLEDTVEKKKLQSISDAINPPPVSDPWRQFFT
jgi:colicin import membrane protein